MRYTHHQGAREARFKEEHQHGHQDWALPKPRHRAGNGGRGQGGFAGSVRVLTRERGPIAVAELEGQTATFMTRDGWVTGRVLRGGVAPLEEIVLVPAMPNTGGGAGWHKLRSNLSYSIIVAKGQPWPGLEGRTKVTLAVGSVVPASVHPEVRHLEAYRMGFRHGMVFADGDLNYTCRDGGGKVYRVRLCGPKAVHSHLFSRVTFPPSANGDPVGRWCSDWDLKDFAQVGESPEYLAGFLAGWIAGDGGQLAQGRVRLDSQHPGALAWLQAHAPLAGWLLTGFYCDGRMTTNFGVRKNPLLRFTLTRNTCNLVWMVKAISPVERREPVFLVVTDEGEDIVLVGGIVGATVAATDL